MTVKLNGTASVSTLRKWIEIIGGGQFMIQIMI